MSTVFEVWPSNDYVPTFDEVLELSNKYLIQALKKNNIYDEYTIDVVLNLIVADEDLGSVHVSAELDKRNQAMWKEDEYAFFIIQGIGGGSDSDCWAIDIENAHYMQEEFTEKGMVVPREFKDVDSLANRHRWTFRRSIGQTAIVNLMYGLVAAAFAKLTDGYLFSDDGAWHYERMPIKVDDFLNQYFSPEELDGTEDKFQKEEWEWELRCIEIIRDRELGEEIGKSDCESGCGIHNFFEKTQRELSELHSQIESVYSFKGWRDIDEVRWEARQTLYPVKRYRLMNDVSQIEEDMIDKIVSQYRDLIKLADEKEAGLEAELDWLLGQSSSTDRLVGGECDCTF